MRSFKIFVILAIISLLLIFVSGCNSDKVPNKVEENEVVPDSDLDIPEEEGKPGIIALPDIVTAEDFITRALYERTSQRNFSARGLDLTQTGKLLWAANGLGIDGITGPTRTIPSAGATYPLDIYLAAGGVEGLEAGIYSYDFLSHSLFPVVLEDRRDSLASAALNQGFIAEAPVVIVMVAHFDRTTDRYGERGERYVYMDVGYASQNIYLMATELGLATVAVGAFDDMKVAAIFLTAGKPLMIMPVGYPSP